MNKNAKLGAAVALAGAAGVFAVSRKKKAQTVKQTRKQQQELADYRNTERGMRKTARAFIIRTVIMKHLPVRKSRKALKINPLIS